MAQVHPMNRDEQPDITRDFEPTLENNLESVRSSENEESLLASISPLLISMRVCGAYFKWPTLGQPSDVINDSVETENNASTTFRSSIAGESRSKMGHTIKTAKVLAVMYPSAVMVIVWSYAIRYFTVFGPGVNSVIDTVGNSTYLVWYAQAAVQQTAYFIASFTGGFDQVLSSMPFNPPKNYAHIRRIAIWITVVTWIAFGVGVLSATYDAYFQVQSSNVNVALTPISNYIPISDQFPFKLANQIFSLPCQLALWFPIATTLMVSIIFAYQFGYVNERLREAIGRPGGISDDDIEEIREQHDKLCKLVRHADRFLRIHNLAAFLCPLAPALFQIYAYFIKQVVPLDTLFAILDEVNYFFQNSMQLLCTSISGILVNYNAHKVRDKVHSIKLSGLSSKSIGKVNVFLDRLSGESIGFTLLGIMTIDRNALITLLGLLVTYFLLLVQLPVDGSSCSSGAYNFTNQSA